MITSINVDVITSNQIAFHSWSSVQKVMDGMDPHMVNCISLMVMCTKGDRRDELTWSIGNNHTWKI